MQTSEQNQGTANFWITRCPECKTAFRITRNHLQAAGGAVRCGSCMHVFQANQYIVRGRLPADLRPSAKATASTKATATPKRIRRPDIADDSLDIDHPLSIEGRAEKKLTLKKRLLLLREKPFYKNEQVQLAAALALVIALVIQVIAYNFTSIALNPGLRPVAAGMCTLFGCELPLIKDLSRIKVKHIVVRQDQAYQNGLVVDAILSNEADFTQPYPELLMIITGKDQSVLGTRRLLPEQYLSGEAAGDTDMPPFNPIHLSLKILSPGADIQNISFDFPD